MTPKPGEVSKSIQQVIISHPTLTRSVTSPLITGIAGIAWHLNGDLPPGQNLILRQDLQTHEELPDSTDNSNTIQKSGNPITIFLLF